MPALASGEGPAAGPDRRLHALPSPHRLTQDRRAAQSRTGKARISRYNQPLGGANPLFEMLCVPPGVDYGS